MTGDHTRDRFAQDWVAEFKAYLPQAKRARAASSERYPADFDWAIDALEETISIVDRLRGRLKRLEWAGQLYANVACCPVCEVTEGYDDEPNPHAPDCWLAAELRNVG